MNEPRRWLDTREAPPEVLALITNAAPVRALDDGAKRRSRRRIAGLTAVPAAAGAFFWVQHVALGAALGTVVASAAVVAPRVISTLKARETVAAPHSAEIVARPAKSVPVPPSQEANPAEEELVPPVEPQKGALPPSREPSPEPLDLVHEARLLERARALLSSDPAAALATLERHAAEAPHGTLQLERELLEVDVLVRLGRRRDAESKARILRAHAPGSLYERRLAALLGER